MEIIHLLEMIGYGTGSGQGTAQLTFRYYNNPDGSVRWLWPAQSTKPHFLKFYHAAGWKARLFSMVTHGLFTLGLQGILFKKISVGCARVSGAFVGANDSDWALFSGTPGPNRKALLYIPGSGGGTFIKIATGRSSLALLERERDTLQRLQAMDIQSFVFPVCQGHAAGMIRLSDLGLNGAHRTSQFTPVHLAALSEIQARTAKHTMLHTLPVWEQTKAALTRLETSRDPRIPKGMLRKLRMIFDQTANRPVVACLAHGDFTPWNMYLCGNRLAIYDWELAHPELPAGFDAFHFIIQQGILVRHQCWRDIHDALQPVFGNTMTGIPAGEQPYYLSLYLLIQTVYYLGVYVQQPVWHRQVYWLLNTWNEGLSATLQSAAPHRTLVLMDLMDFMLHRRYAALKFSDRRPEDLGELSDLDLCIEQKDHADIRRYLAHHHLVRHHRGITKTFMANEQAFCGDGSILSVDLIWQLKRKSVDMMAVAPMIEAAVLNSHGVWSASPVDNARYLALFYALNRSAIPPQYMSYREYFPGLLPTEDLQLKYFFDQPERAASVIADQVKNRSVNKGFSAMRLKLTYLWDVLRTHWGLKGMVITFSGVDGAGKSTVIESLKGRIEKQLRRRTVVLRHRPSLLPILSAWTMGKAAAERASAARLPRQGGNASLLSSLLRFAYYYSDYLFGQFWVNFRYVWRGYVVIYDRYYFDFINDCRRSNMTLPQFLPQMGYQFIIEPDLNFFLYADAALILSRKQELDKTAIEDLTHRYLTLFQRLDKRHTRCRYIAIENIELSTTLQQIMGNVLNKAA